MHQAFPLISVVIPTYNQALYLPEALESVFQQTYYNLEIIVVNDGSTDETAQIGTIYRQKDSRLSWIEQSNEGPSGARNRGIGAAQGDYICLLDSDDLMDPERIALQYQAFQRDSSVDIVYTALRLIDADKHPLGEMHSRDFPPIDFLALMFFRNLIPGPSTIMAKSHCLKHHAYHPSFKHAEDYELMMRLAHLFHFKYLDLPLTSYRRHGGNLSNALQAHRQAELKVLQKYGRVHIEKIVDQTTFKAEEKILLKGRILFNQEHFEDALGFFLQNSSSLSLFYQGNCHLRLKNSSSAIAAYEQSLILDRTNPACYNNLGVAYAWEGAMEKAKQCFQNGLNLKPGYLDAQFNMQQTAPSASEWRITWRELRQSLIPYSPLKGE